jgi:MFS family permease
MFGVIMYTPFYVQGVLGHSATMSGLVEMVMTIAMVASSIISGKLITRTGKYKIIAIIGLTVMSAGLFLNSFLNVDSTLTRVISQLIVVGIGLGITMPVFQVTVQNAVKHKYLGVATSAMQVFRQMGGTIGVAIMGTIMGNLMKNKMGELQPTNAPNVTQGLEGNLDQLQNPQVLMDPEKLEQIKATIPEQMGDYFDQFVTILRESLNYSLTGVFLFGSCIVALAVVVTFFIKEIPLRTSNKDDDDEAI